MYIHNFFCDLLLSIRLLFDKHIFLPDYIKTYEFNISNRTFSLIKNDYKTEFELPASIVTLNTDTPSFGERPNVIQRTTTPNCNMVSVLSDNNNNRVVYLQEEQTQITISIVINCESQLQAKESEFKIRRVLPSGKFIQFLEFTSFLEISYENLIEYELDPKNNHIINLFNKFNKNTGSMDYCYSVFYKPLIRLDSINTSIDSNQRSFPVNLDLTFQIQMPMFIFAEKGATKPASIGINFSSFGFDPISDISTKKLTLKGKQPDQGARTVKRNLLINDLNDYVYVEFQELSKCSFAVKFAKDDFIISPNYEFDFSCTDNVIRTNVPPILIDPEDNRVVFEFTIDEKNKYFNPSLTRPIILQFVEIQS